MNYDLSTDYFGMRKAFEKPRMSLRTIACECLDVFIYLFHAQYFGNLLCLGINRKELKHEIKLLYMRQSE